MPTPAARLHTYYLPREGRCFGVLVNDEELCERLRRAWYERSQIGIEPHYTDGFSAWLDRHGELHLCLVQGMAAHMLDHAELVAEFRPLMTAHLTEEGAPSAPEHPPA